MALAAWRSGRMLVFDQRTFPVLISNVAKLSTRPTQPFFLSVFDQRTFRVLRSTYS